jgi:hypothetical protein
MAFSNPRVYIEELASPLCKRFKAEPTSYDLAISTCIIIYHFADVVAHVRGMQPHEAADLITRRVPNFSTIRALANAGKHVELTRHPDKSLVGLRAEHLIRDKGAAFSGGSYLSDGTTSEEMGETVVVTTPDGVKHDVLSTCLSVLDEISKVREFFYV